MLPPALYQVSRSTTTTPLLCSLFTPPGIHISHGTPEENQSNRHRSDPRRFPGDLLCISSRSRGTLLPGTQEFSGPSAPKANELLNRKALTTIKIAKPSLYNSHILIKSNITNLSNTQIHRLKARHPRKFTCRQHTICKTANTPEYN